MTWDTFWAIFTQTHLVTLVQSHSTARFFSAKKRSSHFFVSCEMRGLKCSDSFGENAELKLFFLQAAGLPDYSL
jgi:hypothetical protein